MLSYLHASKDKAWIWTLFFERIWLLLMAQDHNGPVPLTILKNILYQRCSSTISEKHTSPGAYGIANMFLEQCIILFPEHIWFRKFFQITNDADIIPYRTGPYGPGAYGLGSYSQVQNLQKAGWRFIAFRKGKILQQLLNLEMEYRHFFQVFNSKLQEHKEWTCDFKILFVNWKNKV